MPLHCSRLLICATPKGSGRYSRNQTCQDEADPKSKVGLALRAWVNAHISTFHCVKKNVHKILLASTQAKPNRKAGTFLLQSLEPLDEQQNQGSKDGTPTGVFLSAPYPLYLPGLSWVPQADPALHESIKTYRIILKDSQSISMTLWILLQWR